jgi:presenilin-like A22 family membrane protease
MRRAYVAVAAVLGIFLCVQLGALALVEPFETAGYRTVEDPSDPTNSVVYIGAILVATVFMLAAMKYDVEWVIRGLVVLSAGGIAYYVFSVLLPPVSVVGGVSAAAGVASLVLAGALLVHPEWYVIDAAGMVMGAGAAGLFGISFGLLPALLLLVGLAVYDAISVYGTEHMLTLASGVMDLRVPVVLVIPLRLSYSFREAGTPESLDEDSDETGTSSSDGPDDARADVAADGDGVVRDDGDAESNATADNRSPDGDPGAEEDPADDAEEFGERDAFFIGLGDAVIPTVLVASAAAFAPGFVPAYDLLGLVVPLTALTAMVGTLAGLLVLMRMVMAGRAHAGLPLLNGGAIAGYLVGAIAAGIPLAQALGLG